MKYDVAKNVNNGYVNIIRLAPASNMSSRFSSNLWKDISRLLEDMAYSCDSCFIVSTARTLSEMGKGGQLSLPREIYEKNGELTKKVYN